MKPYFAIQLSCYSELLHEIQKKYPERFSIILGNNEKISLKLSDYYSYYTELKNNFFQFHKDWKPNNFPDQVIFLIMGNGVITLKVYYRKKDI